MIDQVAPGQLAEWFSAQAAEREGEGARAILIDVREPWEVQTAAVKVEGFEFISMPMASVPARLNELDPTQPIACLCHHGARSQRVAQFLAQSGFERLANVAGGIDAWSREFDAGVARY